MQSRQKRSNISNNKRKWRKQNLPKFSYISSLPITDRKDDIIDAISKYQVVIISGETGSGKTTQIPKFCLAAKRGINGKIGCTQPRRIAATTVANRIAEELGEKIGQSVGYKIRFKDKTRHDSFIKIMTDGILLAETLSDPHLKEYDTIIVDEAHERSLNIDFVLGILKKLIKSRKGLKLIITSATIDTEKFSKAFDEAPVIEVSGRMYPVDIRYFPVCPDLKKQKQQGNNDLTHVELTVDAIQTLSRESQNGDILVFMPTEQDIRETCEILEGKNYKNLFIYPLFARLPASEQSKIFSRPPGRKIIVATNVAETSITIPGIRYVVDTGLARISKYSPGTRTTALPVMPVSRSSAEQRKGRCGRVENGICLRLYSEEDFLSRPLFTLPEILRSNLAQVILRMIALNLGDISDFPFIDRPAKKSIKDGFDLLLELGAITKEPVRTRTKGDSRFFLTKKGRLMAKIPIDPR
ncbi:MAG: DEAD/DEAH box helicase, partial [Desulfobacterales bacterium]|nr:DEAD/DEAH box helicase [Desulfobacterales bacterium]